jgi:gliding motility-associated-like protein
MGFSLHAQDFSNKGKDFWVAYGYHEIMVDPNTNNTQQMVLYLAADQTSNVTVSIPGLGYSQSYVVNAGSVVTTSPLPKAGAFDCRLLLGSTTGENKGIHITSDRAIVAYAHIYNGSVSGASILYPTPTLGKEYYSVNYTNISNTSNANCWFYVIATDPGTTTVEITPSASITSGKPVGVPFNVILTQGQVYNVMGTVTGNNGVDLTGSVIKSISGPDGACKKIAVYSGSGRISITCNGGSSSSDNYMVQAMPKTAWGKKYMTTFTGGSSPFNFFRVCVSDPTTIVKVDGNPIAVTLTNGFYYSLPLTNRAQVIEADKPIMVAQYLTSAGACGNIGNGDPEVIYLSPVEQNINKVLWYATPNAAIGEHYINVVIPNTGTAIGSFKLDGSTVPAANFIIHPKDPSYSYLIQNISPGQHTIMSDSGFNAIAYGYGPAESYGYNAGTNIKDIYQYITVDNQYATVNFPATCKGTPFNFSMTFPYQPIQIDWQFGAALNAMGIADVTITGSPAGSPIVPTSSTTVNGKTLYKYTLATPYIITAQGTYPIQVTAQNPTPDGCGGEQEIQFDLQVFDPPLADFNVINNGCLSTPVQFTDNSLGNGRPINSWHYDFGDATVALTANATHTYTAAGTYNVKYAIRTDVGCISDTLTKTVVLTELPVAGFNATAGQFCAGKTISFANTSTINGTSTISKWTWNFGDATPNVVVIAPNPPDQTHSYTNPGTYNVTLQVETSSGCVSTVLTKQIVIGATPTANFSLPNICLPVGFAQFTDGSTVSGGSITGWTWDFGDASPTSNAQNATHNYASAGPFNVTLTATSNSGCTDTKTLPLTTLYAEPLAAFSTTPEVCLGTAATFSDNSTAPGSTVTGWAWDFGDASPINNQQNPTHIYAAAGTYTITLKVTSAIGCQTVNNIATHTVTVNALPTPNFTNAATMCEASAFTLTSTSVPNSGTIIEYSWAVNTSPTGGNTPTLNYTAPTAGTYNIDLTVKTDKGCMATISRAVTVNAKPAVDFSLPTVCLPTGIAQFNDQTTVTGGSVTNWTWDFGDATALSNAQNPAHTYTTAGPFNVKLTATSGSGCVDTKTKQLTTVYAEPQAIFNVAPEVCLGNPIQFTDGSIAANSTVTAWDWDFGDATAIDHSQNPSHIYAAAGTYTIKLKVTSAAGCQTVNNFATHTVIVNALPVANFNIPAPSCVTRNIRFNDASVPSAGSISQWNWDFGNATTATYASGNPFTQVYANAGTYNVTLQVTTNKGCISPVKSQQLIVNVLPKAGFITPEACISDLASQFIDTSKVNPGTVAAWSWNFGDPNANAGNPNVSNAQNATHHFTVTGPYTTQLVAISNQGCTDTITHTFFVNGSVPVASFAVQNPNVLCSNNIVKITDASTVDVGSLVKTEIFWDYATDPTIKTTEDQPTTGMSFSHTYPEFASPASKNVIIRYVTYSGATCLSVFSRTVTLLATPAVTFAPLAAICEDAPSYTFTEGQITNGLPGTFAYTGAGVTSAGVFTPAVAGVGPHQITYTFTGTNGCINSLSRTIDVNPKPGINAGPDKFVLQGGVVQLTPSLSANFPVTYQWTPSTGLNDANIFNPLASPADDITYTVKVTSDKGCTATDDVFVKVLKSPLIPNIFSPNGDGVHDTWVLPYLESYPGATVDIFNRYGQLVFHSVGYSKPWDGKVNGNPVPVGTYYYVIDPKNGRVKMAGYVDVIR